MDFDSFQSQAALNEDTANLLDQVVAKAEAQGEREMVSGTLFALAAYALYRLAKNYFDHDAGLGEVELRNVMIDQVEKLKQQGFSPDEAVKAISTISKDIASLRSDDIALKSALDIIKIGGGAS